MTKDEAQTTKAEYELSRLSSDTETNKRALDMAMSIVNKYSDGTMTETHCSAQDLLSDIAKQFMRLMTKLDHSEKHHEAWLQMQRLRYLDEKPSLLRRIFS